MRCAGARPFDKTVKSPANLRSSSRGPTSLLSHPPRSGFVQLLLIQPSVARQSQVRITE